MNTKISLPWIGLGCGLVSIVVIAAFMFVKDGRGDHLTATFESDPRVFMRSQELRFETFLTSSKQLSDDEYRRIAIEYDAEQRRRFAQERAEKALEYNFTPAATKRDRIRAWKAQVAEAKKVIKRLPKKTLRNKNSIAADMARHLMQLYKDAPAEVRNGV